MNPANWLQTVYIQCPELTHSIFYSLVLLLLQSKMHLASLGAVYKSVKQASYELINDGTALRSLKTFSHGKLLPEAGSNNDSSTNSKWTRMNMGSNVKKFIKLNEGETHAWGKAVGIVHTSPREVLSFLWLYCSHARMKEHQRKDGNLPRNCSPFDDHEESEETRSMVILGQR